jgi:hypothetical protein
VVARVGDKYSAVICYINAQRVVELTGSITFFPELKLGSAAAVDNDDSIVDTIHQIHVPIRTHGDITGLVGVWFNVEKKFAVDTVCGVTDIRNYQSSKDCAKKSKNNFGFNQSTIPS